LPFYNFRVPD